MTTTELTITGLTCAHCAHAITEELLALADVTDVHVTLVPNDASTAVVESRDDLDESRVAEALSEAGDYAVAGVRAVRSR